MYSYRFCGATARAYVMAALLSLLLLRRTHMPPGAINGIMAATLSMRTAITGSSRPYRYRCADRGY